MHNSKYQCHMAACYTHHRPTYSLLAAKQELYKRAYLLTKNVDIFFWKRFRRMDQRAGKKKKRQKQ